jgi:predicted amidohydrolase YtcJ
MARLRSLLATALLLLASSPLFSQSPSKADLLLMNARVVTMNPKQPAAEAIAIKDGRIVWVGRTAQARKLFRNAGQTMDLGGATVLPGINDAHTHLMSLGESFLRLNLKGVENEQQVVELVKQRVQAAAPGQWILGWGWGQLPLRKRSGLSVYS